MTDRTVPIEERKRDTISTLSLFDEPEEEPKAPPAAPSLMTDSQRSEIRSLFSALGLTDARSQFDVVNELIGVRLASVADLTAADAGRLIPRLRGRVTTAGRANTGSSWDDRDEDTWIDRL